mgnify:CR=1 FL=1
MKNLILYFISSNYDIFIKSIALLIQFRLNFILKFRLLFILIDRFNLGLKFMLSSIKM